MSTIPFRIRAPNLTASVEDGRGAQSYDLEIAKQYDQYYTDPVLAAEYVQTAGTYFDFPSMLLVEPSAGDGSFSKVMQKGSIAIDIAPRGTGIRKANFLTAKIKSDLPMGFIGNPPYGRCSNTAVKFINRAADLGATFVAFILPRTFRKAKTQAKINQSFHLIHDEDVPANAFLFCGKPYDVPACFQIWVRRDHPREMPSGETDHPDFRFTEPERADFVLQRVGADAGRIHYNFALSKSSHLFILGRVQHLIRQLNLPAVAANTAGNPSISKSEIVARYAALTGRPASTARSKARRAATKVSVKRKEKR